jgi:hypothetical protein
MASSSAATTRRRKIFPHLEDEKRSAAASSAAEGASNSNDNDNADTSKKADGTSYNNAKSKKGSAEAPTTKKTDQEAVPYQSVGPITDHLIPLPLVFTVIVCSGLFWIASFRDVMATGKPILDTLSMLWGQEDADANYLVSFTGVDYLFEGVMHLSFHSALILTCLHYLHRYIIIVGTTKSSTHKSNTPNRQHGSTIHAVGSQSRAACLPSSP